MPVEDFLSLQATVARPDESDDDEEMEDGTEFIADDETLDVASNVSRRSPLFFEDNDAEEDLEQIAADINARDARSRPQHQLSDNSIRQWDAQMYCFFVPDSKAKQLEAQLHALKFSTSAEPLLEHVLTAPHLPRHIFVLASPVTIAEVVRRFSLPFPRVIPRDEWGNRLDAVPWTQHRRYPLGSFVKVLESGTYHGDLGYVLAIDFKDDGFLDQSVILPTPKSVVIAVVPRIRVNRSGRNRTPLNDPDPDAIREEIRASFEAESSRLEELVDSMREQAKIMSLRKDLMKEKDDLVWRHGQLRREIEKEVVRNAKAKKDLEKELRGAGGQRASSIKKELESLQNETESIQQRASQRLAAENSSYEPQLASIRSKIEAIPSPPNLTQQRKPQAALFDHESVERTSPGSLHHFTYTGDDLFEFTDEFPNCFDRPAIVTDPETHQPVVGTKSLTLWALDSMLSPLSLERIYFYQGRIFFRSLELVPIHDNRALEVAYPNVEDLEPFVQSQFDGPRINRLFSALHWNHGNKLTHGDESDTWYYLREVVWRDQIVRARRINTCFGDPKLGSDVSGLDDVQLHLRWTKRFFSPGDNVEITFGPHKGISGTLITVTNEMVIVMTTNFIDLSVPRDFVRSCITISALTNNLRVGDLVEVVAGRHQRESGTVLRQNNGLVTIRSTKNMNIITVLFDEVQKVSTESGMVSGDVSPHIALRSLVRVLRGPYTHRQGVVSEKLNLGRELVIMDPDNNENFTVTEDQVHIIRIFQNPARASKSLPRPWINATETPTVGDFVQVVNGDNVGKEGCIERLGADLNDEYTITLTSAQSNLPTVVLESDDGIEPRTSPSTIFACPVGLAIYKRIQEHDIIRVLGGTFADTIGSVYKIYHGTGWYLVKTQSHVLRLYQTNLELEDRLCVQDFVRITVQGPFFGKQGTVRKVDAEGNVEVAAITSDRIIHLPASRLQREIEGDGTFSKAKRDPAIDQRVQVIKGPMKGSAGYVVAKNYVKRCFVVGLDFNGVKMNFEGEQLVYFDSRLRLGETPATESQASATVRERLPEPLPERGLTPIPDEALVGEGCWRPDLIDRMTLDSSFLTRGIWSAASGKHVRVVTGADLRNGYTTIPIQFDNPLNPSSVLLYFTNSRGQWKKEYVSLAKSSPSPPNAKDQLAMILNGVHEGRVYKAVKVSRKTKTASFNLDGNKWEEKWDNLCMVEDHKSSDCNCEKAG